MNRPKASPFGELLRYWRRARKRSQLDFATEAGVSSRHVSFLETGRADPSRDMVLLLTEVLDVPLRERNTLLEAAGFARAYRESELDAVELAPVRRSIEFLLERHEPYPAILVDRHWNLLLSNEAANVLMGALLPPAALAPPVNVVRLLFAQDGFRPHIVNWDELARGMLQRVQREAAADPSDAGVRALLEHLLASGEVPADWRTPDPDALAHQLLVPMTLRHGDIEASLFSAITTLGTPLDVTLQELRLETFFPADAASDAAMRALRGA